MGTGNHYLVFALHLVKWFSELGITFLPTKQTLQCIAFLSFKETRLQSCVIANFTAECAFTSNNYLCVFLAVGYFVLLLWQNAGFSLENVLKFCKLLMYCKVKMKTQGRLPMYNKRMWVCFLNLLCCTLVILLQIRQLRFYVFCQRAPLNCKLIKEKNNTKQNMNLDACVELVRAKVHLTPSGPSQMAVGLKALVPSDFAIVQPCTSVVGMRTETNLGNDKKQAPTLSECYAAKLPLISPQYVQI